MASSLNGTGVTFSDASTQSVGTSGNFKFNSGYGSEGVVYGCRAWVNFNGTGTVAIRGSGNVSSITDNGTGSYTVNFTNSLPDANYSVGGMASRTTYEARFETGANATQAAGSCQIKTFQYNTVAVDCDYVEVNFFR